MQFLLEQERAYIGASYLFEKLDRLDINPALYVLPLPYIFRPDELHYYLESIQNDLMGKEKESADYQYVRQICTALLAWADKDYIVHVL